MIPGTVTTQKDIKGFIQNFLAENDLPQVKAVTIRTDGQGTSCGIPAGVERPTVANAQNLPDNVRQQNQGLTPNSDTLMPKDKYVMKFQDGSPLTMTDGQGIKRTISWPSITIQVPKGSKTVDKTIEFTPDNSTYQYIDKKNATIRLVLTKNDGTKAAFVCNPGSESQWIVLPPNTSDKKIPECVGKPLSVVNAVSHENPVNEPANAIILGGLAIGAVAFVGSKVLKAFLKTKNKLSTAITVGELLLAQVIANILMNMKNPADVAREFADPRLGLLLFPFILIIHKGLIRKKKDK